MIAFPRRGLRMSKSGDIVTISMTDNPNDSSFKYYAHSRGTTLKDKFYIGVYLGSEINNKLRSLSEKTVIASKTIGDFRTLARANTPASNGNGGSGYDCVSFYPLTYIQAMYCLKYKNLDSQTAVGSGNKSSWNKITGAINNVGMDTINDGTNSLNHMKVFGLENICGQHGEILEGAGSFSDNTLVTATQNFNDSFSGYSSLGQISLKQELDYPYITKIAGTSEKGFINNSLERGSKTTYYCGISNITWGTSYMAMYSTIWINNGSYNIFSIHFSRTIEYTSSNLGARLMYL